MKFLGWTFLAIGAALMVVVNVAVLFIIIAIVKRFNRFECASCGGHEAQHTYDGSEQCVDCGKVELAIENKSDQLVAS